MSVRKISRRDTIAILPDKSSLAEKSGSRNNSIGQKSPSMNKSYRPNLPGRNSFSNSLSILRSSFTNQEPIKMIGNDEEALV
jgi:hypothetical protein